MKLENHINFLKLMFQKAKAAKVNFKTIQKKVFQTKTGNSAYFFILQLLNSQLVCNVLKVT